METYKNKLACTVFSSIVKSTFLHHYLINFVVNSHVLDLGQYLINGNFSYNLLLNLDS